MPEPIVFERPIEPMYEEFNNATNYLTNFIKECPNTVAYVEGNWDETTTVEDILNMIKRRAEELKANPSHTF